MQHGKQRLAEVAQEYVDGKDQLKAVRAEPGLQPCQSRCQRTRWHRQDRTRMQRHARAGGSLQRQRHARGGGSLARCAPPYSPNHRRGCTAVHRTSSGTLPPCSCASHRSHCRAAHEWSTGASPLGHTARAEPCYASLDTMQARLPCRSGYCCRVIALLSPPRSVEILLQAEQQLLQHLLRVQARELRSRTGAPHIATHFRDHEKQHDTSPPVRVHGATHFKLHEKYHAAAGAASSTPHVPIRPRVPVPPPPLARANSQRRDDRAKSHFKDHEKYHGTSPPARAHTASQFRQHENYHATLTQVESAPSPPCGPPCRRPVQPLT